MIFSVLAVTSVRVVSVRVIVRVHYERRVTAKAGRLTVKIPKLKQARFLSKIIDRYRRREESVDEALISMYLACVCTRRVDDIGRALWDTGTAPSTLSKKIKPVCEQIEQWRVRPLPASYPYVFMDGVWHKRSRGGAIEGVGVLVAIGVDGTGHREVIGVREGMKEDSASWNMFLSSMIERGFARRTSGGR